MIIYTKEYIADNKVMQRNVYFDGKIEVKYLRDVEFKDTKKYPTLKINKPLEKLIEENQIKHVKNIVESMNEIDLKNQKNIEESIELSKEVTKEIDKRKRKKKNEEIVLPKPEDVES